MQMAYSFKPWLVGSIPLSLRDGRASQHWELVADAAHLIAAREQSGDRMIGPTDMPLQ